MTTFAWSEPYFGADLHLIAGLSGPRLDQRLSVYFDPDHPIRGDQLPDFDEVTRLRFTFPEATPPEEWSGIGMDQATGRVWLTSDVPTAGQRRVRYFVVTVTLVLRAGGTEQPIADPLYLKVWSHDRVDAVWLTPDGLTAHQNCDSVRFSLLAKFSDHMVADVSNWSPASDDGLLDFVYHGDPPVAAVSWTAPHGASRLKDLSSLTGRFSARRSQDTATVRASLTTGGTDPSPAEATVYLAQAWDTGVDVNFLDGAGLPFAQQVPNVLFLPDGWPAGTEQQFRDLVTGVVAQLVGGEYFAPYHLLRDSVNFWWAFVPSRQAGITVLPLVDINPGKSTATVSDDPPATPDPMKQVQATIPAQWPVGVLDEVDSAFGCATGERPRARPTKYFREMTLNPWRVSDTDFDKFLRTLRDPDVPDIGTRWTSGGADQDLIVVIAQSLTGGGTGSNRFVFDGQHLRLGGFTAMLSTEVQYQNAMTVTMTDGRLNPGRPGDPARVETIWLTGRAAHEFSHSLGPGDEYGGSVTYQPSTADQVRSFPNLEPDVDTQAFSVVRWRWPRIAKAGVLSAPPMASSIPLKPDDPTWPAGGTRVRVSLAPDPAAALGPGAPDTAFDEGDLVRLRTRPLSTATMTARYRVTATSTTDLPEGAATVVELAPENGATDVTGGDWTKMVTGSVLLAVTVDADDPQGGDFALVHPKIVAHMAGTGAPLRLHKPSDEAEGHEGWLRPDNLPPDGTFTTLPAKRGKLVGLYEGGMGQDHGVYHSTGGCLVRSYPLSAARFAQISFVGLCPVCRYAVTDRLDPTCHPAVDHLYDKDYPQ